jgi:hypothetical protein
MDRRGAIGAGRDSIVRRQDGAIWCNEGYHHAFHRALFWIGYPHHQGIRQGPAHGIDLLVSPEGFDSGGLARTGEEKVVAAAGRDYR